MSSTGAQSIFLKTISARIVEERDAFPEIADGGSNWWTQKMKEGTEEARAEQRSNQQIKKRDASRTKSKSSVSSEQSEQFAMSPPDVSRRPPLPKKTKDDESSSHHSST